MERLPHNALGKVPDVIQMIQKQFSSQTIELPEGFNNQLQEMLDYLKHHKVHLHLLYIFQLQKYPHFLHP